LTDTTQTESHAESHAESHPTSHATSHAFQADVSRLLHLMVHSVYSDRDVFLRELISNAADACEKLRFEALANPDLAAGAACITITIDKDASILTIEDNGIGMNDRDLADALGTIANSGTRAYLEKLKPQDPGSANSSDGNEEKEGETGAGQPAANLIGQFGFHGGGYGRCFEPQGGRYPRLEMVIGGQGRIYPRRNVR
jgi:molecular chaperone HtpG